MQIFRLTAKVKSGLVMRETFESDKSVLLGSIVVVLV